MVNIFPTLWKRVNAEARSLVDPQIVNDALARYEADHPPRPSQRSSRFTPYLGIVATVLEAIHASVHALNPARAASAA